MTIARAAKCARAFAQSIGLRARLARQDRDVGISPGHKLLPARPAIKGISLPGMGGNKEGPFVIYEITEGEKKVLRGSRR